MLTYIVLGSFTDQGLRTVKETTKRADAAKEMAARLGVKMEIYWTQGQYDLVSICQAEDEAAIAAFGLGPGRTSGNVRFQTLRAFSRDEMNGIWRKLP